MGLNAATNAYIHFQNWYSMGGWGVLELTIGAYFALPMLIVDILRPSRTMRMLAAATSILVAGGGLAWRQQNLGRLESALNSGELLPEHVEKLRQQGMREVNVLLELVATFAAIAVVLIIAGEISRRMWPRTGGSYIARSAGMRGAGFFLHIVGGYFLGSSVAYIAYGLHSSGGTELAFIAGGAVMFAGAAMTASAATLMRSGWNPVTSTPGGASP